MTMKAKEKELKELQELFDSTSSELDETKKGKKEVEVLLQHTHRV